MGIYKFQLTSMLSISHRISCLMQSAILSGFALGAVALPGSYPHYLSMVQQLGIGPSSSPPSSSSPSPLSTTSGTASVTWPGTWDMASRLLSSTSLATLWWACRFSAHWLSACYRLFKVDLNPDNFEFS